MGFWNSELGQISGKAEDAFARVFKHIPDGTTAIAKILNFINAAANEYKYINIEWELIEGDFKGQKVNQKIKVFDREPKVKHRALNMLKLIYELYKIKPAHDNIPTDQDLRVFVGKAAGIKIRETEVNENGRQYNWVSEVHPFMGFKSETGVKIEVVHTKKQTNMPNNDNWTLEDDVPF